MLSLDGIFTSGKQSFHFCSSGIHHINLAFPIILSVSFITQTWVASQAACDRTCQHHRHGFESMQGISLYCKYCMQIAWAVLACIGGAFKSHYLILGFSLQLAFHDIILAWHNQSYGHLSNELFRARLSISSAIDAALLSQILQIMNYSGVTTGCRLAQQIKTFGNWLWPGMVLIPSYCTSPRSSNVLPSKK